MKTNKTISESIKEFKKSKVTQSQDLHLNEGDWRSSANALIKDFKALKKDAPSGISHIIDGMSVFVSALSTYLK